MSRNPNATAEAQIAQKLGTEPILILAFYWTDSLIVEYADRDYGGAKGKILQVSGLDSVIKLKGGGSAGSLSITIDDKDSSIKSVRSMCIKVSSE